MIYVVVFSFVLALYLGVFSYVRLNQENLIFLPTLLKRDYKFSFSYPYQEFFFKMNDGAELNALLFQVKDPKGVILYYHGNARGLDHWGKICEDFCPYGYDLFLFDYRGYGKSTGKRNEATMHSDAEFMYRVVQEKYSEDKIIVYGRSLGTGFATKVASENSPRYLILETPYYSFEMLSKWYFPFLPISIILKYRIPTYKYIRSVACPILIMHGTKDETIPFQHANKLRRYLKKKDQFIKLKNGTHSNLLAFPVVRKKFSQIFE